MTPRKPIKRAFHGLVGLPPEAPATSALTTTVEPPEQPVLRKCGRPPKGDNAMTSTERKRAQRERDAQASEHSEREKLWETVSECIDVSEKANVRGELCTVEGCEVSWHKHVKNIGQNLAALREVFMASPIEEVREMAKAYEIGDQVGRLRNERSGEASSKYGMSEMERIIAAQIRDAQGKRVKPSGQGSAREEKDETADVMDFDDSDRDSPRKGSKTPVDVRMSPEYLKGLRDRDAMFEEMVQQHCFFQPSGLLAQCRLCAKPEVVEEDGVRRTRWNLGEFLQRSDLVEHFWTEYERGWALYSDYVLTAQITSAKSVLGPLRYAYVNHQHLQKTWFKIGEGRKHDEALVKELGTKTVTIDGQSHIVRVFEPKV